jgi:hypothetical protein
MLAGAVAAFDIAGRGNGKVHPAGFVLSAAKAGMALNFLHLFAGCGHGGLLSKENGAAGEYLPAGAVACLVSVRIKVKSSIDLKLLIQLIRHRACQIWIARDIE